MPRLTPDMIRDMESKRERKPDVSDAVNKPAHYTAGKIECIDAIEAQLTREQFIGYLRGNVAKYMWRAGLKGDATTDVQKARWYAAKLESVLGT